MSTGPAAKPPRVSTATVDTWGDAALPAPDREILIELLGLHARALRRMPWVETGVVLAIALFMYPFIPTPLFLSWGALTIGVEAGRARYATSVLRRASRIDPVRTHLIFMLLAVAAGGAVGIGASFFLPRLPILDQALLGAILFTMPAAGIAVSQSSRYIVAAYALSLLIPACATWMILHPSQAACPGRPDDFVLRSDHSGGSGLRPPVVALRDDSQ